MSIDPSRSRRTLPSPMVDRSSYSIFSVIKQAIGKDLTRFSIPVVWNGKTQKFRLPFDSFFVFCRTVEFSSAFSRMFGIHFAARPRGVDRFASRTFSLDQRVHRLRSRCTSRTNVQTVQSVTRRNVRIEARRTSDDIPLRLRTSQSSPSDLGFLRARKSMDADGERRAESEVSRNERRRYV